MPLYEYRCAKRKCSHLFEELSRMNGDIPNCPRCKGPTVKLVSAPSFKFKGHGFHLTDYTKTGPKRS
jgi:putative FmdB family regulatory protein